jgi:uncharacterized membrane protein
MRRMPTRLRGIDVVRGLVMVLMAVDHVRVFAGVPAGGPTPGVFFTRWITHVCAPGFLFLAGTSAYLRAARRGDPAAESWHLVTRGLFLIVLELTVLRFAWTFNGDLWNYNLAGVIWLIGWCLVALAALIRLPLGVVATIGAAIVAGHNAWGPVVFGDGGVVGGWVAQGLYTAGSFRLGGTGPRLVILYSLLPWIGVMALGYAFGHVAVRERAERDRWCLGLGAAAIATFLLLRTFNVYGDPRPWNAAPPGAASAWAPLLSFLNTAKYPASLQYLLMTLGPLLVAVPWLDRARGRLAEALALFGRVPLFYYVLHIPLIHVAAIGVSVLRTGAVSPWLFANHPMEPGPPPSEAVWSLPLLYAVTAAVVVVLYVPCRWYAGVKRRQTHPVLSLV